MCPWSCRRRARSGASLAAETVEGHGGSWIEGELESGDGTSWPVKGPMAVALLGDKRISKALVLFAADAWSSPMKDQFEHTSVDDSLSAIDA